MKQFIAKHAAKIAGVLHGWDRIVFHGTLGRGRFNSVRGMRYYLNTSRVLLKDFVEHAKIMTRTLIQSSLSEAERLGRPVEYLPSSSTRKEDVARGILLEHPVDEGLICVLKCIEPCVTFEVRANRKTQRLELTKDWGKCLHLYHYHLDPVLGFMHARIQTWFPFSIQICMNGRVSRGHLPSVGMGLHRRFWKQGCHALLGETSRCPLPRSNRKRLQTPPRRHPRQTPNGCQQREDVRQRRPHSPCRDHHQQPTTLQGVSGKTRRRQTVRTMAAHATGRGRPTPPRPSLATCQRTLSGRVGLTRYHATTR